MEGIPVNQYSWRDTKQVYEHILLGHTNRPNQMFFFPKNQETNDGSDCYNMYLKIVMNSKQTNDWLVQSLMKLQNVLK